jgi:hypothetical protein
MRAVATVFYCIVDARPSLHDPVGLGNTNRVGRRYPARLRLAHDFNARNLCH